MTDNDEFGFGRIWDSMMDDISDELGMVVELIGQGSGADSARMGELIPELEVVEEPEVEVRVVAQGMAEMAGTDDLTAGELVLLRPRGRSAVQEMRDKLVVEFHQAGVARDQVDDDPRSTRFRFTTSISRMAKPVRVPVEAQIRLLPRRLDRQVCRRIARILVGRQQPPVFTSFALLVVQIGCVLRRRHWGSLLLLENYFVCLELLMDGVWICISNTRSSFELESWLSLLSRRMKGREEDGQAKGRVVI